MIAATALGCRGKIYIADELVGDDESVDPGQVGDTNTDTERATGSGDDVETDTPFDSESVTGGDTATATATAALCELSAPFAWTSSGPLIQPQGDAVSLKDPTVVWDDDSWIVYATADLDGGLSMTQLRFGDWDQADAATQTLVSSNPELIGYKAAPQLFYFSPQDRWYLVYQTPDPTYSTSGDPSDVMSWNAPTPFMPMPSMITDTDASAIDYWVICDDTDCYMFFSADNGVLYRARTTKDAFPAGFEGTTEIVMQDEPFNIYDASNVYKLAGTDQYLLLVSAIGEGRYFQSWTSDRLDGDWTPLADTETNAFISINNVTGADWTHWGFSHGEMLRTNPDETMTIDPCDMQYLYSGLTYGEGDPPPEYYSFGLLTLEN